MPINKKYLYNALLVIVLTLSVGTLIWGVLLLINGRSGGSYIRVGTGMTLITTIWIIVVNLKNASKQQ